jgi:hypothetical protein
MIESVFPSETQLLADNIQMQAKISILQSTPNSAVKPTTISCGFCRQWGSGPTIAAITGDAIEW